ncbi:hypothetical protein FKM82_028198 [Ascaphus truei]
MLSTVEIIIPLPLGHCFNPNLLFPSLTFFPVTELEFSLQFSSSLYTTCPLSYSLTLYNISNSSPTLSSPISLTPPDYLALFPHPLSMQLSHLFSNNTLEPTCLPSLLTARTSCLLLHDFNSRALRDPLRSGLHSIYLTETVLTKVARDLHGAKSKDYLSRLRLSAAFKSVDHAYPLQILRFWYLKPLSWLLSLPPPFLCLF